MYGGGYKEVGKEGFCEKYFVVGLIQRKRTREGRP